MWVTDEDISDAIDDCREELALHPPRVADLAPGDIGKIAAARLLCPPLDPKLRPLVQQSALPCAVGTDRGFLTLVGVLALLPYVPVLGARNAMRRDLHVTGVIS